MWHVTWYVQSNLNEITQCLQQWTEELFVSGVNKGERRHSISQFGHKLTFSWWWFKRDIYCTVYLSHLALLLRDNESGSQSKHNWVRAIGLGGDYSRGYVVSALPFGKQWHHIERTNADKSQDGYATFRNGHAIKKNPSFVNMVNGQYCVDILNKSRLAGKRVIAHSQNLYLHYDNELLTKYGACR